MNKNQYLNLKIRVCGEETLAITSSTPQSYLLNFARGTPSSLSDSDRYHSVYPQPMILAPSNSSREDLLLASSQPALVLTRKCSWQAHSTAMTSLSSIRLLLLSFRPWILELKREVLCKSTSWLSMWSALQQELILSLHLFLIGTNSLPTMARLWQGGLPCKINNFKSTELALYLRLTCQSKLRVGRYSLLQVKSSICR